jgi:hypothetical protein
MDFGKSFTYMFDDQDWLKKLAIGGLLALLSIIPIVHIFTWLVLGGYYVRTIRNVSTGKSLPLPEWDDWGGDWVKGLLLALAVAIYGIPFGILIGLGGGIGSLMQQSSSDAQGLASVCVAGLSCLSALWGLLVAIFLPAATINYALHGDFASFFRFGQIWDFIRRNAGNYIIALLLSIVAALVASLGVIACGVGVFFTGFWAALVTAHLLGQVKATESGMPVTPAPPAAPEAPEPPSAPTISTSYGDYTPPPPPADETRPLEEK